MPASQVWWGRQRLPTPFSGEPVESDPTCDTGMITAPQHILEKLAEEPHLIA